MNEPLTINPPSSPTSVDNPGAGPSRNGAILGAALIVLVLGGGVWWFLQPRFEPPQGAHLTVQAIAGAGLNQDVVTNGNCFTGYYLAAYGDPQRPFYDVTLTLQSGGLNDEADVVAALATDACASEQKQVLGQVLKVTKLTSATDSSLSLMYRNQAGHRFILPIDQP